MSAQHLLAAIQTLRPNVMDLDMLDAIKNSLNLILDNDTFNGMHAAAFEKLLEVKACIGAGEALVAAKKNERKNLEAAMEKFFAQEQDGDGSTDNDKIIRLMIRAEEDGTLSFVFRDTRWDWNHNTNVWDMTPLKMK